MKKPTAKQLILGTMALALIGGGGYLLKSQNVLAAAEPTTTAATDTVKDPSKLSDNHPLDLVRRVNDELITFLKLDSSAYKEKIASGKTLAEIAAEQGISRDALKTELTKEVTAELDKEKADFAANLDTTVDSKDLGKVGRDGPGGPGQGPGPGRGGGRGGEHGGFGGPKADLTELAKALGYTTQDELKTALTNGQSIADLAATKKVTVESLITLEAAQIVKSLDQDLASGKITQTEYDAKKADSTNQAACIINGMHEEKGGPGGRGGKNRPGNDGPNSVEPTTAPSVS